MDGKKIGIIIVIIIVIVGFFMFNNHQQNQLAKEEAVKKAQTELIAQKEQEEALARSQKQAQEQQADALELELEAKELKEKELKLEEKNLKQVAEQELQEAKEEQLAKLMTFKNSKHIFYFESNDILLIDSEKVREFFLGLNLLSEANLLERIIINAHTDNIGSDGYNMKLSTQRAKALDEELRPYQLQIQVNANGETNPIASNDTKEGRGLNRRIEVTLY